MINVQNKNAIKKLTKGSTKASKIRNIVAVIAIALTAFMLLTVFSFGITTIKIYDESSLQILGTKADAGLSAPTQEQLELIQQKDYVDAWGLGVSAAVSDFKDTKINVQGGDTGYYNFVKPTMVGLKGDYPKEKDDILMPASMLKLFGIDKPEIGREVIIPIRTDIFEEEGKQTDTAFRLIGWYDDSIAAAPGYGTLYVSEEFAIETGNTFEDSGVLQFALGDSQDEEKDLKDLEKELNLDQHQILKTYRSMGFGPEKIGTGAAIGIIVFFVILSGYLLIYNVFYLSVGRDIRFYGLLKTIGTSPAQLGKIVMNQAYLLAGIGIPIGIAAGTVLLIIAANLGVIATARYMFNPFVYIFTVLFALLTVFISVRKSAKKAAQISPIEAVRFTGNQIEKKKGKRTSSGGKWYRMAGRNAFRDKKRAFVVILSLFVGISLFQSVLTVINSLDTENMVMAQSQADIQIESEYENSETDVILKDKIPQERIEKIRNLDGIKDVYTTTSAVYEMEYSEEFSSYLEYIQGQIGPDFDESYLEDHFFAVLTGISRNNLEKLYPQIEQQDLEAFEKGELVFSKKAYEDSYTLPDEIEIKSKENKEEAKVKVAKLESKLNPAYISGGEAPDLIASDTLVKRFAKENYVTCLYAECETGKPHTAVEDVEDMYRDQQGIMVMSRDDLRNNYKNMNMVLTLIGGAFTFILAFVGMINFVNITITSVQARKRELAILESIGMTGKQIKKMLIAEGLYYGGVSLGLIWTVGSAIAYALYRLFKMTADYAVFKYPFTPMIMISLVIILICAAAPILSYRSFIKNSITVRIRETE